MVYAAATYTYRLALIRTMQRRISRMEAATAMRLSLRRLGGDGEMENRILKFLRLRKPQPEVSRPSAHKFISITDKSSIDFTSRPFALVVGSRGFDCHRICHHYFRENLMCFRSNFVGVKGDWNVGLINQFRLLLSPVGRCSGSLSLADGNSLPIVVLINQRVTHSEVYRHSS